jgi:uncharacterized membrane protein
MHYALEQAHHSYFLRQLRLHSSYSFVHLQVSQALSQWESNPTLKLGPLKEGHSY